MTEQQVLQLINQFIIANGNNEITANVLRPILEEMLRQPNDKIGELADLSTEDKTNIVAAINEVLNTYTSGFTIHAGGDNPNTNPPGSYSIGDWYIRDGQFLYQYNGQNWNPITSIFTGDGNGVLMDDGSSRNVDYFRGLAEWAPDVDIEDRGLNGVFRIYQGSVYKLSDGVDLPYNTGSEFDPEDWEVVVQSGINFSNTPITPILTFEEKQIRQGVLNGEYQIDAFGAVPGSFVVDYITADGVTTPEFGSGINVVQNNYINEEGALNRIFFEFVEGGTVNAYIGEGVSVGDGDYIPNSALNDYKSISPEELVDLNAEVMDYYQRVLDDGGQIDGYLGAGDFITEEGNHGNIIRNIEIVDGKVVHIELDFLKVGEIPPIPASKVIGINAWASAEW